MKKISTNILAVLALLFILTACSKDYTPPVTPYTTLPGKWTYIGSKASSGGPQYFVPAKNSNDYIQLNTDGTMTWTPGNVYKKYTLKDSITLTMTYADGSNYEDYYYRIRRDSLFLSPRGPVVCIEGCSDYFVKK